MSEPHIVILGAGPAGAGAAFQLRRTGKAAVTVLERYNTSGGNAGSFEAAGQRLDYGSHRLHPSCDSEILQDIRGLLGNDLLDRPRHGRIRLQGRWIHFPLRPADLLLRLSPGFSMGVARDLARMPFSANSGADDSFSGVLRKGLGRTICEEFYFPYARKIWGVEPNRLSGVQAKRRVSANSFGKLARKVMAQIPGFRAPGSGRFFYPRHGYGQITEAYMQAAVKLGAGFETGATVTGLDGREDKWSVQFEQAGEPRQLRADQVWSTIPLPVLARLQREGVPGEVLDAAENIDYRAMILIYLHLDVDRFTDFDAHYFPDEHSSITRLSEPKNYSDLTDPVGCTSLCAELPCAAGDEYWRMDDEALGRLVENDLRNAGLALARPPVAVQTRRLAQAYPIYLQGYERHFRKLDQWADTLPALLTYGRQGLFAHDNTHHALAMAYAAVDCLEPEGFDDSLWADYRKKFETHVVED
jgi:protoporphyrinogen oxidase